MAAAQEHGLPPTAWESAVPPEERRRVLLGYRNALDQSEYRALHAWLGCFYKFQLEWLLDGGPFAVCNKSRQIGMTHTSAGLACLWSGMLGMQTTTLSIGQREAREVLDVVAKHATVLGDLGSELCRFERNATTIHFHSGGRVIALPASSGGRGLSGNVLLDEYAYIKEQGIYDAAAPVALHGGRIRIISTPNGVGNDYYRLWHQPEQPGWRKHYFPIERAIADGMRIEKERCFAGLARGDERLYGQLFECKFLDGELQYIPTRLIEACRTKSTFCPEGEDFAGLDIGHGHDLSVLYIVRRDPRGVCWVQHFERRRGTSQPDDPRALARIAFSPRFRVRKLYVDRTGLGSFPADDMVREHGRHRVFPIDFTNKSKAELASTLYQSYASGRVKHREDDRLLELDLASIQRNTTEAGNVTYDAPRTATGHADNAWALALALHACSAPPNFRTELRG